MRKFLVVYFDDILVYIESRINYVDHLRQLYCTHREAKLFANLRKCLPSTSGPLLGFIVPAQGISIDLDKVRAITEWPKPTTITEARSFHGLASYSIFIRHFGFIMAPINDCLYKGPFQWTPKAVSAFREIKERMSSAPVFRHLDFSNHSKLHVIPLGSGYGIRGVLSQEGCHPITFVNEKLNDSRKVKYTTFEKELYALLQSLRHWKYYLLPQEFGVL